MKSPRSQKAVVRKIKGSIKNLYPNVGETIFEIEKAAEYAAKGKENYSGSNNVKSYNFLKTQVKSKDNVTVACAGYYNGNTRNGGHAVAIIGYVVNSNGNYIQYFDPWDGTNHICTYKAFCDGSYNGRKYDQTCYNNE